MDDAKKSAVAILAYLENEKKAGGLDKEQLQSLGVAILSLEEAYGVSSRDLHLLTPHAAHGQVSYSFVAQSPQAAGSDPCSAPRQEASPEDKQEAERLKNEGNDLMKAEKFPEALESYTQAIKKDGENAVYYCNRWVRLGMCVVPYVCVGSFLYYVYTRAAAYGKLREHRNAIEDCKAALSVNPAYSKAYGRMGIAYTAVEKHESAVECHRRAVELEPDSENYRQNLEIAEQKLRLSKSKEAGSTSYAGSGGGWWDSVMKFTDPFSNNPYFLSKMTDLLRDPRAQQIALGFRSNERKDRLSSLLDMGHVLLDYFSNLDTEVPEPPQIQQNPALVQQLMSQVNRPTSDSDEQDDPPNDKE